MLPHKFGRTLSPDPNWAYIGDRYELLYEQLIYCYNIILLPDKFHTAHVEWALIKDATFNEVFVPSLIHFKITPLNLHVSLYIRRIRF